MSMSKVVHTAKFITAEDLLRELQRADGARAAGPLDEMYVLGPRGAELTEMRIVEHALSDGSKIRELELIGGE